MPPSPKTRSMRYLSASTSPAVGTMSAFAIKAKGRLNSTINGSPAPALEGQTRFVGEPARFALLGGAFAPLRSALGWFSFVGSFRSSPGPPAFTRWFSVRGAFAPLSAPQPSAAGFGSGELWLVHQL